MIFRRLALIAIFLLTTHFTAEAGLPFLSETVSWDEDIVLHDSSTLSLHRTVTYGPDEFGRSGRGRLTRQTISLLHEGARVEWASSDEWPIPYMPDIFDFVEGMPVIVLPVYRFGPCKKYGFPQEGMVGLVYRNRRWESVSAGQLPSGLKVNLLRSTHDIQYSPKYKNKRIGETDRRELQGTGGPRPGDSVRAAEQFYSSSEDSCSHIHPPADPQLESAKQRISLAESNARIVRAEITNFTEVPQAISSADYATAHGLWTGNGYLSNSCKDIVKSIEPLRNYDANGGWQLVGQLLVTGANKRIPIQKTDLVKHQAPKQMEQVTCDAKTIYSIRRGDKNNLMIHRFEHSGELIEAMNVVLPDTEKVVAGSSWGALWDVTAAGGALSFSLANYTYPTLADHGGTVTAKQTYAVRLP